MLSREVFSVFQKRKIFLGVVFHGIIYRRARVIIIVVMHKRNLRYTNNKLVKQHQDMFCVFVSPNTNSKLMIF